MASPSILRSWRRVATVLACSAAASLSVPGVRADDAPVLAQAPGAAPAPGPVAKTPPPPTAAATPAVEPASPPAAEPAATATPAESSSDAAPPDELAPEAELEAPEPTLTAKDAANASKQRLQQRLQELEAERASTTNLLPWITVATGAAVVAVSATIGAVNAFDCDRESDCTAPPWASLAVVIGAAISVGGTIWLVRTDDGIRELDLQRNLLKLDLERLEYARWKRQGLARRGGAQVSFSLSF